MNFVIFALAVFYSTLLYLYLHKKTHLSLHYLYKDNILNIILSAFLAIRAFGICNHWWVAFIVLFFSVPAVCVVMSVIRFYRIPLRKTNNEPGSIVSPADGNIIYIKKVESGEIPLSVKNGVTATLNEFANTGIMDCPCWLIGINMTPYDVHKNCAPVDGKLILNKHFDGSFLSLKDPEALSRNERNTIVVDSEFGKIGVVQTASRRVRRIVTYKKEGDELKKGDWFGMIKFGSQVDIIIPSDSRVNVQLKQQVYARKTIIAYSNRCKQ